MRGKAVLCALTLALGTGNAQAAGGNAPSTWTDHLKLAGGIALYYYQPTNGWDNLFIAYANLRFDARYEPFGVHFQPRFSSEKMRV